MGKPSAAQVVVCNYLHLNGQNYMCGNRCPNIVACLVPLEVGISISKPVEWPETRLTPQNHKALEKQGISKGKGQGPSNPKTNPPYRGPNYPPILYIPLKGAQAPLLGKRWRAFCFLWGGGLGIHQWDPNSFGREGKGGPRLGLGVYKTPQLRLILVALGICFPCFSLTHLHGECICYCIPNKNLSISCQGSGNCCGSFFLVCSRHKRLLRPW